MVKCELWKNDSALFNLASSSKTPYTVEPLPDRPAYNAPKFCSIDLILPISGYVSCITRSKSLPNKPHLVDF